MKHPRRLPAAIHILALFATALFATAAATAQPAATGTIRGHVYNPVSKEYVRNAEVRLEGTNRVDFSASDGSFEFTKVPAGPATLSISYSGYNGVRQSFTVSPGTVALREIELTSTQTLAAPQPSKDGIVKLDAFSVSTTREGNSKAIAAQRRDMNIITSVSSDIFGDVTDGNVGEFLKYLPGVDLDYVESEPRGPRLGGMDGQYVGVAFDGMRTANADANRGSGSASRATSFEGFSITSVDSVEINRTASPENDADSPAGTINMKTKRAFDRKGRVFTYAYSLNLNGEEWTLKPTPGIQDGANKYEDDKWAPNWSASYAESFFDKKFGILLSASHSNSYTEQSSSNVDYNRAPTATDPRPMVIRSLNFGDGPKFIVKDALLLTADWKVTPRLTLSLNMNYSYFEGHFQNRSFAFTAANNNANVNNGRATVGGDGILSISAPRDFRFATNTRDAAGQIVNNGIASLTNGGGGASKLTYSRQYVPRFEYKHGSFLLEGSAARSFSHNNYESIERGYTSNEAGQVPSGWSATRPHEQSWEWTIRQTSGADWFDLNSFTNNTGLTPTQATSGSGVGGTRVTSSENNWQTGKWTGRLDATWAPTFTGLLQNFPTKFKTGLKWDEEIRNNHGDSDMYVHAYVGPGGNSVALDPLTQTYTTTSFGNWARVGPQYISKFPFDTGTSNAMVNGGVTNINGALGVPPRAARFEIGNLYHAHPEQFVNMTSPENFYTAQYRNAVYYTQTVNAGYWQADTRLTNKLQVRFGVRAEETTNTPLEFDPLTRPQLLALGVPLRPLNSNAGRPYTIAGMRTMFETNPKVTRTTRYTDWFPSVVLKYQIRSNFEWQIGINKAIARPAVGDITGLWTTNDNANPPTVTAANPKLEPEYHKVYQTRLAYYFGGRSPGQVSIAYIQDEATNFVTAQTYTAEEFGVTDPEYVDYTFVSKKNESSLQRYKNFDLNYNQTLGFLPSEYLRGLSVGATYSRSYANQRRQRLAPHRATARLGYSFRRFSASIGAIWVDDRPDGSVYGRVWGAMTKLDLSASFKINQYATLFLQARNPTNQKDIYYESPPGVQEGKQKYFRSQEGYGDNWVFGVKGLF